MMDILQKAPLANITESAALFYSDFFSLHPTLTKPKVDREWMTRVCFSETGNF